jgi:protein gp37
MNPIGWCDSTINIITGCMNGCDYCYARRMAHRLKGRFGYPEDDPFKPTFHPDKLHDIYNLKGRGKRIFLDSMGDWFSPGVDPAWIQSIMDAVIAKSDHTFLVLTKRPDNTIGKLRGLIPSNFWLGVSITSQKDIWRLEMLRKEFPCYPYKFVSFEPLHGPIEADLSGIEWVIIGAESGNRKGKIMPEWKWIAQIIGDCRYNGIPVYVKNNIHWKSSIHDRIQEFPKEMAR